MIHAFLVLYLLAQAGPAGPTFSSQALRHLQAGISAEKQHQFATAITEYRHVTELAPTAAVGFTHLGGAYLANHQYAEAVASLKHALELAPDLSAAHQLLGYSLLAQGYAKEAIPHLQTVHEVGALGIAQLQMGEFSEAVSNLRAALAKTPGDPDLLYYLSQASEMLSQQSADALLTTYPNSPRAHQVTGQNYFAVRDYSQAEREFQQALALRPDLPGAHMELGEIYAANSQWPQAEEHFRAEVEVQPGSGEAAYRLGDALLQEGKIQEALQELKRSARLRPEISETLYVLGKAASLAGDAATAETSWKRVIAIERDGSLAAQAHFALASLYRKQNRTKAADDEMQQFRRLQERNRGAQVQNQ
jgi:tetratricopeptide (TPR) repeat protein